MNHKFLLTILFAFLPSFVFALIVKGRVVDEKGEGLPFATVMATGTTNGTSANADGYYSIDVQAEGVVQISAQYMGYQSKTLSVNTATGKGNIDFKLLPQGLEVKEVVVQANGEDPAIAIMRKVIGKRKYHADLVKTFETDIYLKGVLRTRQMPKSIMGIKANINDSEAQETLKEQGLDSNGRGVVYLLEQYTHYAKKEPNKVYSKVMSIHQSGDPKGLGFATMPPITNIYDNNIEILVGTGKRGFISPANSNAFLYYNFKFLGSYLDGDRMVNKIRVTPKRKYEPCFTGTVYVVDDEWVFQAVNLTLTQQSQMNDLDTLRLEQTYVPLKKDLWIIQTQVIYPVLKVMGIGFAGNFVTAYKNQKVNHPVGDSLFAHKIISAYDTAANDRTAAYWDTTRTIPLEEDELRNFQFKDSLHNAHLNDTTKKIKAQNVHLKPSNILLDGSSVKFGKGTWTADPVINSIAYNTVEGINYALKIHYQYNVGTNRYWRIGSYNRYGFGNHHFNPLLKFTYHGGNEQWKGRNWQLEARLGQYVYQLNNDNPISPLMNELYTLVSGQNYMKLYENRQAAIKLKRNWGTGFSAWLQLGYEQRRSLGNSTDYTFGKSDKTNLTPNQPANLPIFENHDAAIAAMGFRYQPGWKYIQYPKFKQPVSGNMPTLDGEYVKGFAGIGNSKSNFDKWSLFLSHGINLKLMGTVDYKIGGGGFINNRYVGLPDWKHLFGNQTILANPYLNSFQLAPYYRFSNTAGLYGQAHVEWHLNGWLTNKIPGLRQLNWHLVGGSNALYIDPNNYCAEVFAGLENIGFKFFRFGRVDVVAGYESGRDKPSVGVRIGFGPLLWQLAGIGKSSEE
ncbi:MAG: DUF5686 and carboxypeptidase regulatory-like domain-containing protein [Edaphocola sp.]